MCSSKFQSKLYIERNSGLYTRLYRIRWSDVFVILRHETIQKKRRRCPFFFFFFLSQVLLSQGSNRIQDLIPVSLRLERPMSDRSHHSRCIFYNKIHWLQLDCVRCLSTLVFVKGQKRKMFYFLSLSNFHFHIFLCLFIILLQDIIFGFNYQYMNYRPLYLNSPLRNKIDFC